jgi:hypothetical protein
MHPKRKPISPSFGGGRPAERDGRVGIARKSQPVDARPAVPGDSAKAPSGNMQRLLPEQPRSGAGYAAECPCGSGKVCVGPRGGRFCINASGNKRYGM